MTSSICARSVSMAGPRYPSYAWRSKSENGNFSSTTAAPVPSRVERLELLSTASPHRQVVTARQLHRGRAALPAQHQLVEVIRSHVGRHGEHLAVREPTAAAVVNVRPGQEVLDLRQPLAVELRRVTPDGRHLCL